MHRRKSRHSLSMLSLDQSHGNECSFGRCFSAQDLWAGRLLHGCWRMNFTHLEKSPGATSFSPCWRWEKVTNLRIFRLFFSYLPLWSLWGVLWDSNFPILNLWPEGKFRKITCICVINNQLPFKYTYNQKLKNGLQAASFPNSFQSISPLTRTFPPHTYGLTPECYGMHFHLHHYVAFDWIWLSIFFDCLYCIKAIIVHLALHLCYSGCLTWPCTSASSDSDLPPSVLWRGWWRRRRGMLIYTLPLLVTTASLFQSVLKSADSGRY